MKSIKINDFVYHCAGDIPRGIVVKITYTGNIIKEPYLLTILLNNGKTITDYTSNFSKRKPAIIAFFQH